jgi:arginine/lysine/ornithine decarboxylase
MVIIMKKEFQCMPLFSAITQYIANPLIPFHMPGHTGGEAVHPELLQLLGTGTYKADLTELDALDCLHHPETVIKQTQEKMAAIYNAAYSYLLVNGSTVGLMAAVLAASKENETVLVNRNCHRSVLSGLVLSGAMPVFYQPDWIEDMHLYGPTDPEVIDEFLENHDVSAVFITSPTYEGVVSDTRAIATVCQKYGVPLVVDEAHGAHWRYSDRLPSNAIDAGADLAVQSLHKSCGSLTQSALLHISRESTLDHQEIEQHLRLLQTTSPSYLLMTSLDAAATYMISEQGRDKLEKLINEAFTLREKLEKIPRIELLSQTAHRLIDPTRLFVKILNLSGERFTEILENQYHIGVESLNHQGVLLFLNTGNTPQDFEHLYTAIKEIATSGETDFPQNLPLPQLPKMIMSPREAYRSESISLPLSQAVGRIAQYPIVKCPPGISIVIPGEKLTANHLSGLIAETRIQVVQQV